MRALLPSEHEEINAREYPGTRQLCEICDEPTGNCEDDSILCEICGKIMCEGCIYEFMSMGTEDGCVPVWCKECGLKIERYRVQVLMDYQKEHPESEIANIDIPTRVSKLMVCEAYQMIELLNVMKKVEESLELTLNEFKVDG